MGSSRFQKSDHAALVETLYEAALEPDLLPQALHLYARAFDGTAGNIIGLADHQGRLIISPDGKEGAEAYAAGWWKHDFVTGRGVERRVRGIVTDLDLCTEEEMEGHPFYQEFASQYESHWLCANVVHRSGVPSFAVSIRRAREFGPFLPHELEELTPLSRHAVRMFDIAVKLADAASRSTALTEALTHLGHGVIGLSSTGRVMFTNLVVDGLCGDGLRISNGAVFAATLQGQRAVDLLIAETLAVAEKTTTTPPRPVALARPSGRAPAVLYGVPVPPRHGDVLTLLGGRPEALIVVIEPDAARSLDEQLLREMFNLSPGEARVAAAVATGMAPKDVAASFGMSEGTIRVVLKHVFQKVGVSRQAELVLLLAPLLRGINSSAAPG
jgi:DNA-binding CsgD family transcriptional regulator